MLDAASIAAIAITEPQAGADLSRLATTAERSGRTFVLRGRKTWVTHGLTADVFIVLARTADGPTRFIVPGNTQGLERTALEVVGLKHLTFAELQFDACTISEDHVFGAVGKGLEGTKAAFPIARALAALQALRLGEAGLDIARTYARDRNLFGRNLTDSAVVQDRTRGPCREARWGAAAGLPGHSGARRCGLRGDCGTGESAGLRIGIGRLPVGQRAVRVGRPEHELCAGETVARCTNDGSR